MTKMTKEERASRAEEACYKDRESKGVWDWVVQQQDAREGPLVEFIRKIVDPKVCLFPSKAADEARNILAAYDALDAKPEPTLLEAVKAADARAHSMRDKPGQMYAAVLLEDWLSIKAAVEREEDKR